MVEYTLIKTKRELELMKIAGRKLSLIFKLLKNIITPGITGMEIEKFVEKEIKKQNAFCSFEGYNNYQYCTCISPDNFVVHNPPNKKPILSGSIVGIDIGLKYQGMHVDKAQTYSVGKISSSKRKLIKTAKTALTLTIESIRPGITVGKIGETIQEIVEKNKFFVIKNLTGHGIGKNLHEPPTIYNYKNQDSKMTLKPGMCLAIEPIIASNTEKIKTSNTWRIQTLDNSDSAHFEETIEITTNGNRVLTE